MMFDLFYRILPRDLDARPLQINAFLPVFSFTAYKLQGYELPLSVFVDLERQLLAFNDLARTFRLKGLLTCRSKWRQKRRDGGRICG